MRKVWEMRGEYLKRMWEMRGAYTKNTWWEVITRPSKFFTN